MPDVLWLDWYGCYAPGLWAEYLYRDALKHPAKFSQKLIFRIIKFGIEQGYWQRGQTLCDPFGGVATGAIATCYYGLSWVGVELEPHFHQLAQQNIDKNKRSWRPGVTAQIIQGDSRNFAELIKQAQGCVTSPPYAECIKGKHAQKETAKESRAKRKTEGGSLGQSLRHGGYGQTEGNIGGLPIGAVTSPPEPTALSGGAGILRRDKKIQESGGYPVDPGNYSEMDDPRRMRGQIADSSGATYWGAMRKVYTELYNVLPEGGWAAVNVKDYVHNKKRVELCQQTADMLAMCGFEIKTRVRAWLVEKKPQPTLLDPSGKKEIQRKSFFKKLWEKKGSPKIDWEEVLFVQK